MAILSIEHLSKEFYIHNAQKRIRSCQDITLRLQEGEFIGIVGLSGAGKSTILKCIHRTYLATTGSIVYDSLAFGPIDLTQATEREILYLRRNEIGYVSQFLHVMPRTTAKEHVMNALLELGTDSPPPRRGDAALLPPAGEPLVPVPEHLLRRRAPAPEPGPHHGQATAPDAPG